MNRSGRLRGLEAYATADLLKVYRFRTNMTQRGAAKRSGIGMKLLSAFECGRRIESMTFGALRQLLQVYGVTLLQFALDLQQAVELMTNPDLRVDGMWDFVVLSQRRAAARRAEARG